MSGISCILVNLILKGRICHYTTLKYIWRYICHGVTCPANTSRLPNVGLMLIRRLRRRSNIDSTLGKRLLFASCLLVDYSALMTVYH